MTTTTQSIRIAATRGAPLPIWRRILRLPKAWAELQAFRRMDPQMMQDAGLTQADLDAATLGTFLRQPVR